MFKNKWFWVGILTGLVLILSFVYNLGRIRSLICGLQGGKRVTKQEILQVADKKALELGYETENMVINVEREDCIWRVHYTPKEDTLGGDLEIYVDDVGKIKKVLHWQ